MLSDERIAELYEQSQEKLGVGSLVTVFDHNVYAHTIEREGTTPLIEQIKEDEALMRQALIALYSGPHDDGSFTPEYRCAIEALRKRLEGGE